MIWSSNKRNKTLYHYSLNVTLAQEVPHEQVPAIRQRAAQLWSEYRGDRVFRAERAVFVQATLDNCWIDLAEYSLVTRDAERPEFLVHRLVQDVTRRSLGPPASRAGML